MELELEKGSLINILDVASIAGYSREANLWFSSEGLRIINQLEDQLLVEAFYSDSFFSEYSGDNLEVGLDCKHLNRLAKFIDGKTVRVEVRKDEFLISGENTRIYFSPFEVEDESKFELKKTPSGEALYNNQGDMTGLTDSYVYAQTHVIPPAKLRPLGGVDELIFRVSDDHLYLVQQTEGVKFEKVISDKIDNPSDTSVYISSKNLIGAMNVLKLWYRDITIGIPQKEKYPIIFHDSGEDHQITVLVAQMEK